jgi:hypothetical protein
MSSKCVKVRLNASFKRSLNGGPAAPLGEEVIAGHVGAPVGQHFGHVAQADRGQLEGSLEAAAARPGKERTPDWRQGARLDGLVVGDALAAGASGVDRALSNRLKGI